MSESKWIMKLEAAACAQYNTEHRALELASLRHRPQR
jgi:hypothetical protein